MKQKSSKISSKFRVPSIILRKINKAFHHPFIAILYCLESFVKFIIRFIFKRFHIKKLLNEHDFFNIPIYIVSYNRLTYLQQMLTWLENYGYSNIIIIDNNSNYEPLLKFYETCKHKIIRMDKNYGHTVLYKSKLFFWQRMFGFYVLTDPDLAPIEDCPGDFIEQFMKVMNDYPGYYKVGFSLKIDDIPDEYYAKHEVIAWESQFYERPLKNSGRNFEIYKAKIDTTFALHSPGIYHSIIVRNFNAIRVGSPYQLRHLPWYVVQRSSEDEFYNSTIRNDITNWNGNFDKAQVRKMMRERIEYYEAKNSQ